MPPETWQELMHEWAGVELHNRPFYSVEVIEDTKQPVPPKETRVVRSFYDLSKSAAFWTHHDFTVE
jgi:hypothetical protein